MTRSGSIFACGSDRPPDLGEGYSAVARESYRIENQFGDVWFELALKKAEGASTTEFCRQVRALSRDDDMTTAVCFSPDGSQDFIYCSHRRANNRIGAHRRSIVNCQAGLLAGKEAMPVEPFDAIDEKGVRVTGTAEAYRDPNVAFYDPSSEFYQTRAILTMPSTI